MTYHLPKAPPPNALSLRVLGSQQRNLGRTPTFGSNFHLYNGVFPFWTVLSNPIDLETSSLLLPFRVTVSIAHHLWEARVQV